MCVYIAISSWNDVFHCKVCKTYQLKTESFSKHFSIEIINISLPVNSKLRHQTDQWLSGSPSLPSQYSTGTNNPKPTGSEVSKQAALSHMKKSGKSTSLDASCQLWTKLIDFNIKTSGLSVLDIIWESLWKHHHLCQLCVKYCLYM